MMDHKKNYCYHDLMCLPSEVLEPMSFSIENEKADVGDDKDALKYYV